MLFGGVGEVALFTKLIASFKACGVAAISSKAMVIIKGLCATAKYKYFPQLAHQALLGLQGKGYAYGVVGLAGAAKAILNFLLMFGIAVGANELVRLVTEGIEYFNDGMIDEGFDCLARAFQKLLSLGKDIHNVPELYDASRAYS